MEGKERAGQRVKSKTTMCLENLEIIRWFRRFAGQKSESKVDPKSDDEPYVGLASVDHVDVDYENIAPKPKKKRSQ